MTALNVKPGKIYLIDMRKVGIFSGTFDPVHEGHLKFAVNTMAECGLEKVFFMVEPWPRRKQGVKAYEHRLEMVRCALKNYPNLGMIILSNNRFTVEDTLPKLKARFTKAQIYMLMGDDMLQNLITWPKLEQLLDHITLAIGQRELDGPDIRQKIKNIEQTKSAIIDYQLIPRGVRVSSRQIKSELRAGHRPEALPEAVFNYIKQRGLYSASSS